MQLHKLFLHKIAVFPQIYAKEIQAYAKGIKFYAKEHA
jgi:hypothetical protein